MIRKEPAARPPAVSGKPVCVRIIARALMACCNRFDAAAGRQGSRLFCASTAETAVNNRITGIAFVRISRRPRSKDVFA